MGPMHKLLLCDKRARYVTQQDEFVTSMGMPFLLPDWQHVTGMLRLDHKLQPQACGCGGARSTYGHSLRVADPAGDAQRPMAQKRIAASVK